MNTKKVLMPRGTALWLKCHTKLTSKQIQDFCEIDFLTLGSLTDTNTKSSNPITLGQLTEAEIKRCEENSKLSLRSTLDLGFNPVKRQRKYFTQFQKSQRPSIVAWFIYYHPKVSVKAISQLLHTKTSYIEKLINEIQLNPDKFALYDPTKYGFCSESELNRVIEEMNNSLD